AALVLDAALARPASEAEATELYDRLYRQQYEAFVPIATNVHEPARPDGERAVVGPDGSDRIAFLSLVSGLPRNRLLPSLAEHAARRRLAEERTGGAVAFGEEEGFAFLGRRFHGRRLAVNRACRIGDELTGASLVYVAAGVTCGDQ